jgi:signal transduction histidine kinase
VSSLVEIIGWLNLALYTAVAVVAFRQWRAGRGSAGVWAAVAFGALALVADVGRLLPEDPDGFLELAAQRLLIAVLVLFPYLLYRFTTAFQPPTRRLERGVGLMTAVVLLWTFALPEFPSDGEPYSGLFTAYLVAFLVHWTVLSVIVAVRLWYGGSGQPSVARRRMRLLTLASLAITIALFVAAFAPEDETATDLLSELLVTTSALGFLLGIAPPAALRWYWRRPEQSEAQQAIARLMRATTEREVADEVLPPMARIVGARAIVLRDALGRVLGSYGTGAEPAAPPAEEEALSIDVPGGELLVWTTPYAPYFGTEEFASLRTLGTLTGLALDRARLFAQEREARAALERAHELKTNFVALAAHELRTPVTSVVGFVETLVRRAGELGEAQTDELKGVLLQQSRRMRALVEQLLDLSRLDAEAVEIRPERLAVRRRLEEIVTHAAGERTEEVRVVVEPEFETRVDPGAFDRIVTNLVVNALRYGAPPVTVAAVHRDRHLRLSVEDRGDGVPPEFVPQLFERFSRSDHARARATGSGLGLAIASSYAKAHGGSLLYEQAEPHGARFELVIPAPRPERNASAPAT